MAQFPPSGMGARVEEQRLEWEQAPGKGAGCRERGGDTSEEAVERGGVGAGPGAEQWGGVRHSAPLLRAPRGAPAPPAAGVPRPLCVQRAAPKERSSRSVKTLLGGPAALLFSLSTPPSSGPRPETAATGLRAPQLAVPRTLTFARPGRSPAAPSPGPGPPLLSCPLSSQACKVKEIN